MTQVQMLEKPKALLIMILTKKWKEEKEEEDK